MLIGDCITLQPQRMSSKKEPTDKFRAVFTRKANGASIAPVRLAVEYRLEKCRPVFLRGLDENGSVQNLKKLDQLQLLEAYDSHRFEMAG